MKAKLVFLAAAVLVSPPVLLAYPIFAKLAKKRAERE